jgi:hypothetical protein
MWRGVDLSHTADVKRIVAVFAAAASAALFTGAESRTRTTTQRTRYAETLLAAVEAIRAG